MISIDMRLLDDLNEIEAAIDQLNRVKSRLQREQELQQAREAFRQSVDGFGAWLGGVAKEVAKAAETISSHHRTGEGEKLPGTPIQISINDGPAAVACSASAAAASGWSTHRRSISYPVRVVSGEHARRELARLLNLKQPPFCSPTEAIQDDHLVCLVDGQKRQSLKRWLRRRHGMSWQDYLEAFDLPADYPSICPALARKKSKEAIRNKFGRKQVPPAPLPETAARTPRLRPPPGYVNPLRPRHFQHKLGV